jgi:hypothetical protein
VEKTEEGTGMADTEGMGDGGYGGEVAVADAEDAEAGVDVEEDAGGAVSVPPCSGDATGCPELLSIQVVVELARGYSYTEEHCSTVGGLSLPYTLNVISLLIATLFSVFSDIQ